MSDDVVDLRVVDLRISEAAQRTGFDPSAIRYYERIGLIPEPARSVSGHRIYDAEDIERLSLIANAKALGLSLDDIKRFMTSRERGECPTARAMLEELVAAKLKELEETIADMAALRDGLTEAYESLRSHSAPHRCGEGCGCDVSVDSNLNGNAIAANLKLAHR